MDRLGAAKLTYQQTADNLGKVCKTQDDWLKIAVPAFPLLADLAQSLGIRLTEKGVRGFLNLWQGALRNGKAGHYMAHFYNVCTVGGTLDAQGMAKILEMFDDLAAAGSKFTPDPADLTKWTSPGGWIYTQRSWEGHRISHILAHTVPNYIAIGKGPKSLHSVFSGLRKDVFASIDEAWTKPRVNGLKPDGITPDPLTWVCDMGRSVGTAGERKVFIVVDAANPRFIVTAFPMH